MKLVEFSVTNYRSITKAHKIKLQELTVLVGKNNEGKSNVLNALNVAMKILEMHSHGIDLRHYRIVEKYYIWERDFPVQYQSRKSGLESIFRLDFKLEEKEKNEFHSLTGIRGNEVIPIQIKIGKDGRPKIDVPKKGSSSYTKKSVQVTDFIAQRIFFNYIQAVRTENMAMSSLREIIRDRISVLETNEEYTDALAKVKSMQDDLLQEISKELVDPLKVFLPNIIDISIKQDNEMVIFGRRNDFDVLINDGTETSIINKGDGIKSLVTLALLKERKKREIGASIIAIEEPESHLHSGAIHNLVEVINKLSGNSQVIITTHNPLFVQQNKISSNVIVNGGTARQARNISEIREILGVLPSDNLRNARYVLVVEGEDDKISLQKILSLKNETIKHALQTNKLVIKPMGGASNLAHDLVELKNSMCKYVVLLDNDKAGIDAYERAENKDLIKSNEVKFTSCPGQKESEFEDCIKPAVYTQAIEDKFAVDMNKTTFRGNKKWSDRVQDTFVANGARWGDRVEEGVKLEVAQRIASCDNIDDILIPQKSGFIDGLIISIEAMLKEDM